MIYELIFFFLSFLLMVNHKQTINNYLRYKKEQRIIKYKKRSVQGSIYFYK